jgi:glycerol uptake facilitator protein
VHPFLAELIGTCLLILLGDGVVAGVLLNKSKAQNAGWMVICCGWAIGVVMAIYAVGSISGAHLNPAVTLALAVSGDFSWGAVPIYITGQLTGAFLGACLVWLHYLPHWKVTENADLKLAVFCTAPAIRHTMGNFISEFLGTMVLVFGILFIGANTFTQGLNPVVIGLLILAIGLCLGGTTGWAINPARDLGPRIAHAMLPIPGKRDSDWNYAWIPIVGPLAGGVFGAGLYDILF